MYKNDRVTRRYSEPFKLKILSELPPENITNINLVNFMALLLLPLMNGFGNMNVKTL